MPDANKTRSTLIRPCAFTGTITVHIHSTLAQAWLTTSCVYKYNRCCSYTKPGHRNIKGIKV